LDDPWTNVWLSEAGIGRHGAGRRTMKKAKVTVSLRPETVKVLDEMVERGQADSRSQAVDLCVSRSDKCRRKVKPIRPG